MTLQKINNKNFDPWYALNAKSQSQPYNNRKIIKPVSWPGGIKLQITDNPQIVWAGPSRGVPHNKDQQHAVEKT